MHSLATATVLALVVLASMPAVAPATTAYEPHVIVGVPDSGINPYHKVFFRPERTAHPCTYIPDFPCGIPALELTLNAPSYAAAVAADAARWRAIQDGDVYWIPRTVFVAVVCHVEQPTAQDPCILDLDGHGTGTTSSILAENPDALIAFKEGSSRIFPLEDAGIPIDIYSESWGNVAPVPGHPSILCVNHQTSPLFVTAAGNDPRSTLADCRKGEPSLITVGGAYAHPRSDEAVATKQPEIVSYFCRPVAAAGTLAQDRSACGTSFAAPTAAGALSKVVLGLRRSSGYTGNLVGDVVDPVRGVTTGDVRDAMNRTASYAPAARYYDAPFAGVPLYQAAPWVQWGWGFYDGRVADATLAHMLGTKTAPEKPAGARQYMELTFSLKTMLYGPLP